MLRALDLISHLCTSFAKSAARRSHESHDPPDQPDRGFPWPDGSLTCLHPFSLATFWARLRKPLSAVSMIVFSARRFIIPIIGTASPTASSYVTFVTPPGSSLSRYAPDISEIMLPRSTSSHLTSSSSR